MEYEFEYRDRQGALRKERVEAADRAACVAACRARGIVPVRVAAVRGPRRVAGQPGGEGRFRAGLMLAVGVAALALGLVAWLWPHPASAPTKGQVPAVAKPKTSGHPVEKPARPHAVPPAVRPVPEKAAAPRAARAGLAHIAAVVTNGAGFVVTTVVDADGRTNLVTETLRPQTFTDPMLQLIAAAVGGAYESELAPLPPVGPEGNAQLRTALEVEIPDLPDDTDEVRRLKEAVRSTREEMLKLLDKGLSVGDILTQHQELWNENVRIRREMKDEYRRTLASGDEDAAAAYLEKVNGVFRDMGIPEITADEVRVRTRRKRK